MICSLLALTGLATLAPPVHTQVRPAASSYSVYPLGGRLEVDSLYWPSANKLLAFTRSAYTASEYGGARTTSKWINLKPTRAEFALVNAHDVEDFCVRCWATTVSLSPNGKWLLGQLRTGQMCAKELRGTREYQWSERAYGGVWQQDSSAWLSTDTRDDIPTQITDRTQSQVSPTHKNVTVVIRHTLHS